MFQAGIAIVERDATVESLVDLYFGTGEAKATRLLGDLEATALPLHDVVVADHTLMHQAADTVEVLRSGTPHGFLFARQPSEPAVVVSDELAQHGIGGVQVQGFGQTQFASETILQHSPQALDATFGLRAWGGEEGNAQLVPCATGLGGVALSR